MSNEQTKTCPSCGATIPADAVVCPNCLARLTLIEAHKAEEGVEEPAPVQRPERPSTRQRILNVVTAILAIFSLGFAAWLLIASRGATEPPMVRADRFYAEGQYQQATQIYRSILAKEPENEAARLRLGWCLLNQGEYAKAIEAFQAALSLNPQDAEAHLGVGKAAYLAGEMEVARQHLEKARKLAPGLASPHSYLGQIYAAQGDWEQAAQALQEALKRHPDDRAAALKLAEVYLNLNKPEQALDVLGQAALHHPDDPEVTLLLGRAQRAAGQWDKALQTFQTALQTNPDDPQLLYQAGTCAYRLGDYSQAKKYLQRSLETSEVVTLGAGSLEYLGQIYLQDGEYAQAEDALRRSLALAPNSAPAAAALGEAIYHQRGCNEARPWFQRALDLDPSLGKSTEGLQACWRK